MRRAAGATQLMLHTNFDRVVTHYQRRMCALMLLANGYSSKEIAQHLRVTKKVVDNDVLWWQNRLGARSRTQVAAIAVAVGLLRPRDLHFDGAPASLVAFMNLQIDDPVKRLAHALQDDR